MRKIIKYIIISIYNKRRYHQRLKGEIKNIKRKKMLWSKTNLSIDQKNEIKDYFIKNYGKNYSDKWHRLYQSYTGKYDKKYFPEILYSTQLEKKLNPTKIAEFIEDKALIELLYGGVAKLNIPKTYVLNCSGIFYDAKRNVISRDEALKILANTPEVVLKKTVDSSSGRSIRMCKFKNGIDTKTGDPVQKIFEIYNNNFIAQECIENCKELKALHPSSINTFRVMTYITDDKIYHAPILLRIGTDDKRVDNAHAGGIFVGVTDAGKLLEKAFSEYGNEYDKHPTTGIEFKNYHIPKVKEMLEIAYICHGLTPHLKIISWDFTINKNNEVVLIEVNTTGQSVWLPQIAHGCGIFGENTEKMYKLIAK